MKKISRLAALSFLALSIAALPPVPADAAQVAVTVEALTVGQGFIVEPELVDLPQGATAAEVLIDLLRSKKISFRAKNSPTDGNFFLERISTLDTVESYGWMITVRNFFIKQSAGLQKLQDGDVIRWQYTASRGQDLGEDPNNLGTNTKANKDALIFKVAEINKSGKRPASDKAYDDAITALTKLNALQGEVDAALAVLNGGTDSDGPGGGTDSGNPGGSSGGDGGSDNGTNSGNSGGSSGGGGTDSSGPGGTTAGVKAQIIEKPVISNLPDGVSAGADPHEATGSDMEYLGFGDIIATDADGGVTVSGDVFGAALVKSGITVDTGRPVAPLPVFRVGVPAGGTAVVTLKVSLGGYAGVTLGSVSVFKMTYKGSAARLDRASSGETLKHGSFVWTDGAGGVTEPTETVTAGGEYFLSVAIRDDSDFDLDGWTAESIVDPLALAVEDTNSSSAGEESNNTGAESPGGGGGCDTGASGVLGVIALAVLGFMTDRGRGRQDR